MSVSQLIDVHTWVFDLDNTLYPPEVRLFDQIEVRMTAFVMEALGVDKAQADHLRQKYWAEYGTTLAGLMDEHGVDPAPYLTVVHDIDFGGLSPDPGLRRALSDLPGRRIIYTNGTADYAAQVADARGILDLFDAIYGVEQANFRPKPERNAFEAIARSDGFDPDRSVMFEDDVRNLAAPKAMGMGTVLVAPARSPETFVDHHTDDLTAFLGAIPTGVRS